MEELPDEAVLLAVTLNGCFVMPDGESRLTVDNGVRGDHTVAAILKEALIYYQPRYWSSRVGHVKGGERELSGDR